MARNSPVRSKASKTTPVVIGEAADDGEVALHEFIEAAMTQAGFDGVEARARGALVENGEDFIGERAEFLGGFLARLALAFVDGLDEGVALLLGHRLRVHEIGPELAVAQAHDEIAFTQAKGAQDIDEEGDQLDVGLEAGLADDVAVELVVFAAAAFLRTLVAIDLRDGEPLERFLEILMPGGDEARQGRRHLGTQRDVAITLVFEMIKLRDYLISGLLCEKIERFQGRAVVLDETIAPGHLAPLGKDGVARGAVVRVEITKTG